jgi:hypothetical protein
MARASSQHIPYKMAIPFLLCHFRWDTFDHGFPVSQKRVNDLFRLEVAEVVGVVEYAGSVKRVAAQSDYGE